MQPYAQYSRVDALIMLLYTVGNGENQGKRKLCHRLGAIGRHIANRNPQFGGGPGIHDIIACGKRADITQAICMEPADRFAG